MIACLPNFLSTLWSRVVYAFSSSESDHNAPTTSKVSGSKQTNKTICIPRNVNQTPSNARYPERLGCNKLSISSLVGTASATCSKKLNTVALVKTSSSYVALTISTVVLSDKQRK